MKTILKLDSNETEMRQEQDSDNSDNSIQQIRLLQVNISVDAFDQHK